MSIFPWSKHGSLWKYLDIEWSIQVTEALWLNVPHFFSDRGSFFHCLLPHILCFPPLLFSPLSVLHLSLNFFSMYTFHFAFPAARFLPPFSPVGNKWGCSSCRTEVGLRRSGGGSKGWTGTRECWPEEIQSDGWTMGEEWGRKKERRRDDGELSFHFLSVWLLDDEGHYSLKGDHTLAHTVFSFLESFVFVHTICVSSVLVTSQVTSTDRFCTVVCYPADQ